MVQVLLEYSTKITVCIQQVIMSQSLELHQAITMVSHTMQLMEHILSISNITLDSYDITTSGTATSSGDVGGSSVVATENRAFDVAQLQIGTLNLPNTTLTGTLKTTTGKSIHGIETPFTLDTTASNTVLQDNIYFTSLDWLLVQ